MEEDKNKLGGTNENDSSVSSSNDDLVNEKEIADKVGEKIADSAKAAVKDTVKIAGSLAKLFGSGGLDAKSWVDLIVASLDLFIKVILPVLLIVGFILFSVFSSQTVSSESSVESWYKDYKSDDADTPSTTATNNSQNNSPDKKGDTPYEQGIFDYNYLYSDDLANPTDNKEKEKQSIYYNSVFQAYEMYKNGKASGGGFWNNLKNWWTSLFSSPKEGVPLLDKNKPYNVYIDFSLMTSALYSNRMYTETFTKDKQENFWKAVESAASNVQYYDLHTTAFRDKIEKEYFELALQDDTDLTKEDNAKVGIDAIQILSKYMIQRTESYYTIIDDIAGISYDYTRNIKIINNLVSEDCQKYLVGKGSAKVKLHRGTGGYSWVSENNYDVDSDEYKELRSCKSRYNINNIDNAKFNSDDDVISGYVSKTYALNCEDFKEYLLGTYPTKDSIEEYGGEDTYFSTFIPIYYHQYVIGNHVSKESFKDKKVEYKVKMIVDNIYSMFNFYQNSTGNYSYCSPNYNRSQGDLSCGNGSVSGGCNYDDYSIYVYKGSKSNIIAGPMSMAEYLTRVSYAEIGHMFDGSGRDEVVKANMVIAKTYMLYHLNRGTNGAEVDPSAKSIYVKGVGSGGFQAFKSGNVPRLEHFMSLYSSVSSYVLLNKDGGGIFDANYAMCTKNLTSKGIQNILYAFGDKEYGSSAALRDLKTSGINYKSANFLDILNYIISVGATNYNCSINNYYSNAKVGTCTDDFNDPGYSGGGGSGELGDFTQIDVTNSLEFYSQSTSFIGLSAGSKIAFAGSALDPTNNLCAPASLSMVINYLGTFGPLNSRYSDRSDPIDLISGRTINSSFCTENGKNGSNCNKMMTVVKLAKYLIDNGLQAPNGGARGAVTNANSWILSFGARMSHHESNPSISNISQNLSGGKIIIGRLIGGNNHYIVIYGVEGNQILYHDPGSQSGNNLKTSNINSFGHNSKRSLGEYYVFERA